MRKMNTYITITGLEHYMGKDAVKIGTELLLVKDVDNSYDDEAIKVVSERGCTYGYVANSVRTVARGTHSAGYVYDKINDNTYCSIDFIVEGRAIAKIKDNNKK